jgi:hypothetical protein
MVKYALPALALLLAAAPTGFSTASAANAESNSSQGLNELKSGAVDTTPHAKELHLVPSTCQAPCIDYDLSAELEDDWIFAASPSSIRSNNLYPTLESVIVAAPIDHLSVYSDFIFEPVIDEPAGRNQAFDNLGAYVYQLFVAYDWGPFNLEVGKFHPPFGHAWDWPPGLHATDLAGNYELEERLGMGGAYSLDAFGFENIVQLSAFTTDRGPLSGSIFTHRPRTRLSDGGAGNTRGVSSIVMTLDGCSGGDAVDCYSDGDFGYNLGLRYQRAGQGDIAAERGVVAGVNKTFVLDQMTVRLFDEVAYFRDFEGSSGNALFLTTSGELDIEPVSYSLAYSIQKDLPGGSNQLVELAAGYNFGEALSLAGEEWSIAVGYTFERDHGENSHLLGLLLSIDYSGSLPSAGLGLKKPKY